MVRTPYQRAGNNLQEAHAFGLFLQLRKLIRCDISKHIKLACRRLQVLAKGENIHTMAAQVGEDLQQFLPGLTESSHPTRLGQRLAFPIRPGAGRAGELLCRPEDFKGSSVAGPGANPVIEPRNGLHVVGENIERRLHDTCNAFARALEIRHQGLDPAGGKAPVTRCDGGSKSG